MTTFLDTNVLIAILDETDPAHIWAVNEFQERKTLGPLIVVDIVYCEFSIGMESKEATDEAILALGLERISFSDDALFRAGEAYKKYKREHAGPKTGVLPDFLIGATAESENVPLMTLNERDFVNYFPNVDLIHPQN